jgi:hypothetical protein
MPKIRILVVDDSVVFRRALSDEFSRDPALEWSVPQPTAESPWPSWAS